MKKLMIYFAAGCLGALANSLLLWLAGEYAITKALGVSIAPALTPAWLYPRIVWGGLWGFCFYCR
jgi:putative flippase GtrA